MQFVGASGDGCGCGCGRGLRLWPRLATAATACGCGGQWHQVLGDNGGGGGGTALLPNLTSPATATGDTTTAPHKNNNYHVDSPAMPARVSHDQDKYKSTDEGGELPRMLYVKFGQ